jgi:hypothetical protein
MFGQQLYSSLIYSLGGPVSARIGITANGVEYGNFIASYSANVKQYNGQDYSSLPSWGLRDP